MKIYVILAKSFRYNDEYWDREDGGNVNSAFRTFEEANKDLLRLEFEQLAESIEMLIAADYAYERLKFEILNHLTNEEIDQNYVEDEIYNLLPTASEKAKQKIYRIITREGFNLYEIQEVELNGSTQT